MVLLLFFLFSTIVLGSDSQAFLQRWARTTSCPPKVYPHQLGTDVLEPPPLRVEPLIVSGPAANRIDLVFFSDGYLSEDYDTFIADSARLAKDISGNQTFNTVKPLLNFWAAFSPSNERGIGVGGKPKDTVFGLFRDGTELRGVYYAKPKVAEAACKSLGVQCDYPILLGNDPHYGGLGGDFTVITSSLANGPLVLRHELGHSIINVGEEYDGGPRYFGVNAAHDLLQPVPWAHWLSAPLSGKPPRVERANMPVQQYAWTMLNTSTPWSLNFLSPGTYHRYLVKFSLSGLPKSSDLKVELDGVDLGWMSREDIGLDRWHYDIYRDTALQPGQHEIKFELLNKDREGHAQLCSVEILEFGDEKEFISSQGNYGIYPTFSDKNVTSYRPTNDECLMRTVTLPTFCNVCLEGLWLSLLKRINLIDGVREDCELRSLTSQSEMKTTKTWVKTLSLEIVPLAQFRGELVNARESYTITWWKDKKQLVQFTNQTRVEIDARKALGQYSVVVQFATSEVRNDEDRVLFSHINYNVTRSCNC